MARRRVMLAAGKKPRLPPEYQEVEWIQTDGNAYFTFIPFVFSGHDFYLDIQYMLLSIKITHIISSHGNSFWYVNKNSGAYRTYLRSNSSDYGNADNTPLNEKIDANVQNDIFTCSYSSNQISVPTPTTGNTAFALFAYGQSATTAEYRSSVRMWSLTMGYAGGNKIELVPCYRKSDSKPGIFDVVSKRFFTNAGTGEFTVGPDVN